MLLEIVGQEVNFGMSLGVVVFVLGAWLRIFHPAIVSIELEQLLISAYHVFIKALYMYYIVTFMFVRKHNYVPESLSELYEH